MKKETKQWWKESLLDSLLEIILGLICLAIGAGIFVLFGKRIDDIDFEFAVLLGLGVILAFVIVIYLIIRLVKKKKQADNDDGISPLNKDKE